jgi:hypothetical protein
MTSVSFGSFCVTNAPFAEDVIIKIASKSIEEIKAKKMRVLEIESS